VVVVGLVIFGSVNGLSKAGGSQSAESAFQARRAEMIRRIEQARRG
jgi:hypothetical protein